MYSNRLLRPLAAALEVEAVVPAPVRAVLVPAHALEAAVELHYMLSQIATYPHLLRIAQT